MLLEKLTPRTTARACKRPATACGDGIRVNLLPILNGVLYDWCNCFSSNATLCTVSGLQPGGKLLECSKLFAIAYFETLTQNARLTEQIFSADFLEQKIENRIFPTEPLVMRVTTIDPGHSTHQHIEWDQP